VKDAAYWDAIVAGFLRHGHRGIWRDFSDQLNTRLVTRHLANRPLRRLLKTDLFDEGLISGVLAPLHAVAKEIHGIDLSPLVVHEAQKNYPLAHLQAASVTALPFPIQHFEAVVCLSTLDQLESFAEIEQGLSEIHRVLEPEGRLLITFDNLANPLLALRNRLGWFPTPYFMGQSITPSQLGPLLRRTGFKVEQQFTYMHAPRPLAIRICRLFEDGRPRQPIFNLLRRLEALNHLPTRNWTANYCGALARRS
jgi:SAM-dependent methyltransferase